MKGAQASFNFTGRGLRIYGATGPGDNNYTVTLDPKSAKPNTTSLAVANATEGRTELFAYDGHFGSHEVLITNEGSGLLLDLFVVETALGAEK